MSENTKNLLNENTIRRMMKMAQIDSLSDNFVGALTEKYGTTEEEVTEEVAEEVTEEVAEEVAEGISEEISEETTEELSE